MELKEYLLFPPLKAWFNAQGFKVYCEVPHWGRSIDFVAIKGDQQIAVEMKTGLTSAVIRQAYGNRHWFHGSYAAVGTKPRPEGVSLCKQHGLGVLAVRDGQVIELAVPTRNESPLKPYRQIDFSTWEEGQESGKPQLKGEGVTYDVIERIEAYIRQFPQADWRELHRNVQNHYSSHGSMASSLSNWRGFSLIEAKKRIAGEGGTIGSRASSLEQPTLGNS